MERVVLLAHGAGSSPDVVRRLLGPCLPAGVPVEAPSLRGGADASAQQLAAAAEGREVVLAGGISMGAHSLALLAGRTGAVWPLVLAMPAWTGPPGDVAAVTVAAAADVERRGRAAVLAALADDPLLRDDWVREELAAGWSTYDDDAALVAALRAAAESTAPTPEELAAVRSPAVVVALADDPLHPAGIAADWAALLPRATLRSVGRHAPARDRGALGAAAAEGLAGLSGSR